MNYMQDALKKKKTITVNLEIDPEMGTAEIADPNSDEASPDGFEDSKGESNIEGNENKGMAPNSPEVMEETKKTIEDDKLPDGAMSEDEIANEFSDASKGSPIGKPRSLQEALMKKANDRNTERKV